MSNEDVKKYLSEIGKRGGKARVESLTDEEKSKLGKKAAQARWGKKKPTKKPTK